MRSTAGSPLGGVLQTDDLAARVEVVGPLPRLSDFLGGFGPEEGEPVHHYDSSLTYGDLGTEGLSIARPGSRPSA